MGGATVCCLFYAHLLNRDPRPKTLFCWLRLGEGPNARVLVRCDGTAISIDANGDGRFDAGERFANHGRLAIHDGESFGSPTKALPSETA